MKTTRTCLTVCILATLFISSCDKSDLEEFESGYHRVRIYDDTLPDPRSHSIHIAAGDGKLLMTYGNTFEQLVIYNGNLTIPPPSQNFWMLTDNDGNLIKKDRIPIGLTVADVVLLSDNSFMFLMYTGIPGVWGGPEWTLHIMRLDPNGVMGPSSLLNVPTIHPQPFQQISNFLICAAPYGNALISFNYGAADGVYSTFVGEMDTQGNFLWQKNFDDRVVTGCVSTPDGGYMVSGSWYSSTTSGIYVMKTNSTFDSTWSRSIVPEYAADGSVHITPTGNDNYWVNYMYSNTGKAYSQVLEMNAGGEIVNSNSYPVLPDLLPYNLSNVLLRYGASGIFISHSNSINSFNNTISDQFYAMYATLDENLNVTNASLFQDQTSDLISSACRTSDGRIACFGITQIYNRPYYKPELIIIN